MVWVVLLTIALVLLAWLAAVVFAVRGLFRRSIPQLAIVATCVGGLYVAYKLNYPDYSYRYRMQFSVLADEKEYTGASVIEVRWRGEPSVDPSRFLSYN